MVLYLAADLLWASRIKATAAAVGVNARPVRSLEMLNARLADAPAEDPVRGVFLDLQQPEEAMAMLARLRGPDAPQEARSIPVICWAPHVETDLMAQAKAAGADRVLTRGAFDAQLEGLIAALRQ
jgi:CheY-like chemotaxis protein